MGADEVEDEMKSVSSAVPVRGSTIAIAKKSKKRLRAKEMGKNVKIWRAYHFFLDVEVQMLLAEEHLGVASHDRGRVAARIEEEQN